MNKAMARSRGSGWAATLAVMSFAATNVGCGGCGTLGPQSSGGRLSAIAAGPVLPPDPVWPIPSPEQLAWQRQELTAFLHFGINTFTGADGVEVGTGRVSPSLFNPSALDANQWVSTFQAAGFKEIILTAKHHDGFCLWPSKYTDYSVKNSPWRDGKGDVVREFTAAAQASGIHVGLYLSPLDNHEPTFGTPDYDTYFRNQVTELLTNYGPVYEIWFDGNQAPRSRVDWSTLYQLIKELQPQTLIWTGPEIARTGVDLRWVGTESGVAPLGETSVRTLEGSIVWYPSSSDVSIRPGWFYHAAQDSQVKPLIRLLDIFLTSVGRNSVLLLNSPPDRRGLLADPDVARLGEFADGLSAIFETNLALGQPASADTVHQDAAEFGAARAVDGRLDTYWAAAEGQTSGRLEVDLGAPQDFNVLSIQEPIELGERSRRYHVEVEQTKGWVTIASGTVIGQRNLLHVPATTAQRIALVIEQARGAPAIAEFGVYASPINFPITVDDADQGSGTARFNYLGSHWNHTGCSPGCYNNTNSWQNTADEFVTLTFRATQIKFYGVADPGHGIGAVSIDGGEETNIDFYRSTRAGDQLLYTSPTLNLGDHVFKLRVTGKRNPSSTNTFVAVDRVDIVSQ